MKNFLPSFDNLLLLNRFTGMTARNTIQRRFVVWRCIPVHQKEPADDDDTRDIVSKTPSDPLEESRTGSVWKGQELFV